MCSAPCLMRLYISIKFHENIFNGFQVMERTQIYLCRISNTVRTRVMVLVFCVVSGDALYFYEVS